MITALLLMLASRSALASGITIDATVSHDQNTASGTVTSPAFSTISSGELLLAFISADQISSPNTTVTGVSGGGLSWVLVKRTNRQQGTAEIWRAFAPNVLSNVTVTATLSQTVVSSITVSSFTGVATGGISGSAAIGATADRHAPSGEPFVSLVTTGNNSLVIGVGNDFDNAIGRTYPAGQTLVHQDLSSTQDTYWVQRMTAPTALKGTRVTLSDTSPTSDQYNFSLCEILASAAGPAFSLNESSLSFGSVADGSSKTLPVTLTSNGTSAVTVSSDSISGTGFSIVGGSLPATLAPGGTLTFEIAFSPTAVGNATGQLTLNSNSVNGTSSVLTLSGSGLAPSIPQLTLSTSSLSFGSVTDGSSKSMSLTLTSTGTTAVTISSAVVSGTGFLMTGSTFPQTLAVGQALTLPVSFAPTVAGAVTGSVSVVSNSSSGGSAAVVLTGTGTATVPTLALSASSMSFGSVTDGTSKSMSLTLTSTGTSPVTVSSVAVSGAGFLMSGTTFPQTLAVGQSLAIPVSFSPTAAGAVTGSVNVVSNSSSGSSAAVVLTGTGTATIPTLGLSASSLSFGSVTDGSSKSMSLTLTSTGTSPVTVSSVAVSGTGFLMTGSTFPQTLAVGQSLTLPVSFSPTAAGAVTGSVNVVSNSSSGSSAAVALTGTGTATISTLGLSTSSLSFGSVNDGSTSSLPVTLTSTGTSPVTITSGSVTGTGFTLESASFPITLNPGATTTLTVQFAPTAAGIDSGQLSIASNSSSGAAVVLSGTGVAATVYTINLSWAAPTSSTDPVAGYDIYRSVGGTGTFTLLNSSVNVPTTYVDSNVVGGTLYEYMVKSVDSSGNQSTDSNSITVTTP